MKKKALITGVSGQDSPTVLTFWHHSRRDILKRVGLAGFKAQFIETISSSSQKELYMVIAGTK